MIRVGEHEDIDNAIRRFKKRVEKEGILNTLKRNQYFEKPSDKKSRERREAIKNAKKKKKRR